MNSPFRLCPSCGSSSINFRRRNEIRCTACHFHYFHNVAAAVGVFIRYREQVLVAVRGREPGLGLLDLPGGFTEPGESLEQALTREIREELGIELPSPRYVGSYPNEYLYDGVLYHTADAIFEVTFQEQPSLAVADDVAGSHWIPIDELTEKAFAFVSVQRAVTLLRERHAGARTDEQPPTEKKEPGTEGA